MVSVSAPRRPISSVDCGSAGTEYCYRVARFMVILRASLCCHWHTSSLNDSLVSRVNTPSIPIEKKISRARVNHTEFWFLVFIATKFPLASATTVYDKRAQTQHCMPECSFLKWNKFQDDCLIWEDDFDLDDYLTHRVIPNIITTMRKIFKL